MELWKIIALVLVIVWLLLIFTWIIIESIRGDKVKVVDVHSSGSGQGSIRIGGVQYLYDYSPNVLKIYDSHTVGKRYIGDALERIKKAHPDMILWRRTMRSLRHEWYCHNLAYAWGIKRERTKDVDLNYYTNIFAETVYWIVGWFAYLLIK